MKKITILFIQLFLPFMVMSQSITVSPAVANDGQTLDVTITGTNTHFSQSATSVSFGFDQGTPTNSKTIVNDTSIIVNITVPVKTIMGNYDVSINNSIDGNVTLTAGFFINGFLIPSFVSINPSSGNNGQTLNVTITGSNTHFTQANFTDIGFGFNQGSGTTVVNSMNIINDSSIQANITIPIQTHTCDCPVYVNNNIDGQLWVPNGFHVNGIGAPSIVSVSPAVANNGQTLNVLITGKNTYFSQSNGMSVGFGFGNPNSINIINDSSVQVNVTVPAQTSTGNYNVAINNSIDGLVVLNNGFHITGLAPPSISINPPCAKPGETLNVTITGISADFSQASASPTTITLNNSSIVVNSTSLLNDSTIIVNITSALNTSIGNCILSIQNYNNSNYVSLSTGFYIYDNCFSHYTTTYNNTDNKFTLILDSVTTALGTTFYWDFGDGTTSTNQTPTHMFALDSIYNVCLKVITATGDSCDYCHSIGKNNYGEIFRTTGFSLEVLNFNGTTGIVPIGKQEIASITVSPNPASDIVVVTTDQMEALRNPILSVYNAEGQLLLQQPVKQRKTELNISNFAKGVYLIKISGEEQTAFVKFVKE